ncbi:DNA-binding protein [Gracilibacillus salinarum]|uniref:DNA-binding protein n=1 Tax=Gracilibacillus salinarum TaxID=2932255 RepID=A0ABY4GRD9_9BACI|nr:DNA-binding protein [Gracilibacillus salinarum]UOQ86844.1 DNA-binding protein [Gracilibacillus salinarum]
MSFAVYKETGKEIEQAFKEHNKPKIEKETSYILSQLVMMMMGVYSYRIKSIYVNTQQLHFNYSFITSDTNRTALLKWLDHLASPNHPYTNNYEFGKFKVDVEQWYYQIGGKEIAFDYHQSYLLKPSDAAEQLGVSTVTLNKYVKQGFEYLNNSSHYRIPKHMIPLWHDTVYAIRVQMMFQQKKIWNQKPEERLKEVVDELLEFQMKYKADTVKEAFQKADKNDADTLPDYYEWESLEDELRDLKEKVYGA